MFYGENSEYQAYMIVRNEDTGVGIAFIDIRYEKSLVVTVQLDRFKFDDEDEMCILISQLVDSLGLYCYNKENISIKLTNNIYLSKYNYIGRSFGESEYSCDNKKYNSLIPLLLEEIKGCEDILVSWKQTWWQEVQNRPLCDLHYLFDDDFLIDRDIPLYEIFNKAESINWSSINSDTAKREGTFNVNGDVKFSRRPKKKGVSYEFEYNVVEDGFVFKNSDVSISDNSFETKIETRNGEVIKSKKKGTKKITYKSDVINKSSIYAEVRLDNNDDIDKCYIDFRTHRNNGKINGMYLIRINNRDKKFSFSYRTRKGNICKYDDNIYYDDERLSMGTLKNRIEFFRDAINSCYRNGRGAISSDIDISDLVYIEKNVVNFMKQIKSEIPLPYLQEQIDRFILEYSNSKKDDKVKKLV